MVTAVVHFFHHTLHVLDAVDGYAFFAIGNLTTDSTSRDSGNKPTVGVVLIDQKSNEDYYWERSPLDRCELTKDLQAIYALPSPPKLLVIDLDLSPALLEPAVDPTAIARNDHAAFCDEQLLTTLKYHPAITRTVVMAASRMLNARARVGIAKWRPKLAPFVAFAEDPTISVRYGLVNDVECIPTSIAATAYRHYSDKTGKEDNCLNHPASDKPLTINPGNYFSTLRAVPLSKLPSRVPTSGWREPLPDALTLPVIFLGTSYGDDDTFLTPLGTMYGVEVHAAAFTSLLYPTSKGDVLAFFLDIGIALGLGSAIAWSWRSYFKRRFSSRAFDRQLAPWLIILLVIGLIVVLAILTLVSYWLLRHYNIWLSPIPIAVGMLFESFFNSAVSAAVGEGYEQRQALVRRLQAAHASGPDSFASQVTLEASQRPRHAHSLRGRAARFCKTDFRGLRDKGHKGALALLILRRTAFVVLLLWLLWAVFWEPLHSFLERLS